MLNWFNIALGAVPALIVAFLLHTVSLFFIEQAHTREMKDQKAALEQSCATDKAITQGANDALQKNLSNITAKLNAAKRMHPSDCVVPTTNAAVPPAGGLGHAGQNGISTDWLREYAAECEGYRQERIILEDFIDHTWR